MRRSARAWLAAVAVLALVELSMAAFVYRDRITPDDWAALRDTVQTLPAEQPVYVATPWLDPVARMELPRAAAPENLARPDLRGAETFHVVGFGDDHWGYALQDDLEEQPMPRVLQTRRFGALALTTLQHRAPATVLANPLSAQQLQIETDDGPCRRGRPLVGVGPEWTWTCEDGRLKWRLAEIDYRPRRCLAVEVPDGTRVTMAAAKVSTGNMLRGHLGFDDYNRRLRSDAPVTLTIAIDGTIAARWVVSDEQGWWPFAVPTTPGRHDIEVSLLVGALGTFTPDGYQSQKARVPCLEIRAVSEEAPA